MSTLNLSHTLVGGTLEDVGHVQTNFTDIVTWANGNVGDVNFPATAGMYTAYRRLLFAEARISGDQSAATYFLLGSGFSAQSSPLTVTTHPLPRAYLDDADYSISGRTTRLRVRGTVSTNATQPTITFTFGLYPVTFAGGADALTATLGTVVASSTAAVASPAGSSTTAAVSSEFAVPSDGFYVLGCVTSATLTNNNYSILGAELQLHWV